MFVYLTNKQNSIMKTLTVSQIRRILFETEKYTVIGSEQMSNKESRDFLYDKQDQGEFFNVIENDTHLLIW